MSETYTPSGGVGTAWTRFTAAEAATGTFGTMDRANVTQTADRTRYLDDATGLFNFPAVQVLSAGANVLDDYEEGIYNPTLTPLTSGSITLNASFDTLQYTKVGRMVHVHGSVNVSSVSSPVGAVALVLPFSAGAGTEHSGNSVASLVVSGATAGLTGIPVGIVNPSGNVSVYEWSAGSVATTIGAKIQAGTDFYVSITYSV